MRRLPPDLAKELGQVRRERADEIDLDESRMLPAWERYDGAFFRAAGPIGSQITSSGAHLFVISGGYGLVLGQDSLGVYNGRFRLGDWPNEIIQRCLLSYASSHRTRFVLTFASRTTDYAEVVRRTPWRTLSVEYSLLITPRMLKQGGVQKLVPQAAGEAFGAFLTGGLTSEWTSSSGLPLDVERLA